MDCKLSNICKQGCSKSCELNTGYSLAKFLREVDVVESHIGEFAEKSQVNKNTYIVSGMQLDSTTNPVDILSDTTATMELTKKFNPAFGKTSMVLLNNYIKVSNCEDGAEIKEKLRKIEANKLLIMIIKPKMHCEITAPDRGGKIRTTNSVVDFLKWYNNPKSNQFECIIGAVVLDEVERRCAKINLQDYGNNLRLLDIERMLKNSDINRDMIKMTRFGFIQPIVIKGKGASIAIDNTYVYKIEDKCVKVIAQWDKNDINGDKEFSEMCKTAPYKRLEKNIDYIGQHRRYIAPLGLAECTAINV